MSAAALATWSGRQTCIFRRKSGGGSSRRCRGRSRTSGHHAQRRLRVQPSHFRPSPHRASTARFRPCSRKCRSSLREGKRVLFAVPNTGEVERLADIFTEYNVSFRLGSRTRSGESYADETSYFSGEVLTTTLVKAYVPDGVIVPDANLAIFGARDLFDESDAGGLASAAAEVEGLGVPLRFPRLAGWRLRRARRARHRAVPGTEGNQAGRRQRGVHVAGVRRGRAPLCAAHAARPGAEISLVGRREAGAQPSGHAAWAKTKARVRKAMKDMADELLKLYAERKTAQGHAFPADTEWQREFEDAFEFNETEDQAQAIIDVKRDMESSQPMDRLLCGDVGYGKTEVAMRAAFKAISDNKQVAVLAPTTVLAFQHYETFKQRFAAFPGHDRDDQPLPQSPKQQKEILQKVEAGEDRHPDRHAPLAFEGREVRRSRTGGRRRRAALRRAPQRAPQADAQSRWTC